MKHLKKSSKLYITKFAYGRWWTYMYTKKKWKRRHFRLFRWWFIIISYKTVKEL